MAAQAKPEDDCTVEADTPAEEVAAKLIEHGSVLCRGALSAADLEPLRENAERFFGHIEYCALNNLNTPVTKLCNVTTLRMAASVLALNTKLQPPSLPLLELLQNSYVRTLLQSVFGQERAMFLYHFSRVRKVYPETHALGQVVRSSFPYHQDGIPIGDYSKAILCWVPLTPCGADAPGLEIALKPQDELIPLAGNEASDFKDFEIPEDSVEAAIGDAPRWRPEYRLGDVQLIPSTTLHRTAAVEGMTRTGIVAELRFVSPEDSAQFPREKRRILL